MSATCSVIGCHAGPFVSMVVLMRRWPPLLGLRVALRDARGALLARKTGAIRWGESAFCGGVHRVPHSRTQRADRYLARGEWAPKTETALAPTVDRPHDFTAVKQVNLTHQVATKYSGCTDAMLRRLANHGFYCPILRWFRCRSVIRFGPVAASVASALVRRRQTYGERRQGPAAHQYALAAASGL